MGLWNFKCSKCGGKQRKLLSKIEVVNCTTCNTPMTFTDSKITNQNKDRLDNGLMAKAIERIENVEEIMQEWSDTEGGSKPINPDNEE